MDIAIIGAGNVGGALAKASARAGHKVTLTARNSEHAKAKAADAGANARAATSNAEAVRSAQVVIFAVPYPALESAVMELGGALDGKVVVDVTNRLGGAPGSTIDGKSAAEQVKQTVPNAKVVKAFNTVFAQNQAEGKVDGTPVDNFIASDDADAKATVIELSRSIGLRPIDAGPLAFARALEAMAALNITLNAMHKWPWRTAWKLVGPGPG